MNIVFCCKIIIFFLFFASCSHENNSEVVIYSDVKKKYMALLSYDSYLTRGVSKIRINEVEKYIFSKRNDDYGEYSFLFRFFKDDKLICIYGNSSKKLIIECRYVMCGNDFILSSYVLWGMDYKWNDRFSKWD